MRGDLIRRGPGGEHLPPRQRAARPGRIRGDRAAVVRVLGSVAQARQRRRLGRMRRPPPTRRPARSSGHVTFGFPDSASVSWLLAVADMGGRQSLIASCADELAHGREGIVEPVSVNDKRVSGRLQDAKTEIGKSRTETGRRNSRFSARKWELVGARDGVVRANARNVGTFPQSLPTRQNNRTVWLG